MGRRSNRPSLAVTYWPICGGVLLPGFLVLPWSSHFLYVCSAALYICMIGSMFTLQKKKTGNLLLSCKHINYSILFLTAAWKRCSCTSREVSGVSSPLQFGSSKHSDVEEGQQNKPSYSRMNLPYLIYKFLKE